MSSKFLQTWLAIISMIRSEYCALEFIKRLHFNFDKSKDTTNSMY